MFAQVKAPTVARLADRRPAWSVAAAVTAAAAVPYLVGLGIATRDRVFTGLVVLPEDTNSYLAKMLIGASGDWLFRLTYSPDAHSGAPLFSFFLALGHLARLTGLPEILVFHLARVLAGIGLVLMAGRFYRGLLSEEQATTALWIFAVGSGLGWLAVPFGATPPDISVPEFTAFTSVLANPHFALATAAEIAGFMWLGQALQERKTGTALRSGAAFACVAILQPFMLAVVAAVTTCWLVVRAIAGVGGVYQDIRAAIVAGVLPLLAVAPIAASAYLDPFWSQWAQQYRGISPSPPAWEYLVAFGIPGALALIGITSWLWHTRSAFDRPPPEPEDRGYIPLASSQASRWDYGRLGAAVRCVAHSNLGLMLVWLVINLPLLYEPSGYQRRFSEGVSVPVAAFAAIGWGVVVRRLASRVRHGGRLPLLAAIVPSQIVLLAILVAGTLARPDPIFLSSQTLDALAWLRTNSDRRAVVLTGSATGNLVPAWSGNPVVYGHRVESLDAADRRAKVDRFFRSEATIEERRSLVEQHGVRYVLVTPAESSADTADSPPLPDLELVYRSGPVSVFRVTH